ncbi:hypothetical protein [Brevundimonas sp.]|uniref:hypothetical protein n=1 Tax=Brevundimonas sp. TaxID=1871086 RepID=UPI0028B19370|nr:hypothetical protein [Brevundimonas sp.]
MTPDAALDRIAFLVGLRLMGPDARRRLRLALVRSPDFVGQPGFNVEALDRLDALLDGRREPETSQDRCDLIRAEEERLKPPFNETFWLGRLSDLIGAGFPAQQAAQVVQTVRAKVQAGHETQESFHADQSKA